MPTFGACVIHLLRQRRWYGCVPCACVGVGVRACVLTCGSSCAAGEFSRGCRQDCTCVGDTHVTAEGHASGGPSCAPRRPNEAVPVRVCCARLGEHAWVLTVGLRFAWRVAVQASVRGGEAPTVEDVTWHGRIPALRPPLVSAGSVSSRRAVSRFRQWPQIVHRRSSPPRRVH